jgi:hypothetical protein
VRRRLSTMRTTRAYEAFAYIFPFCVDGGVTDGVLPVWTSRVGWRLL